MSSFNDFISIVNSLPSGSEVIVNFDWCTINGLTVTANMMKGWGQSFANGVRKGMYGCVKNTSTSPSQGTASHLKVTNLCTYVKI